LGLLRADHVRAKKLGKALSGIAGLTVNTAAVDTNIVIVELEKEVDPDALCKLLKEKYVQHH
jgi:threonine aldolase